MKLTIEIPPFTNLPLGGRQTSEAITDLQIALTEGSTPEELVDAFRTAMYALSYHPDTIKNYLPTQDELDERLTEETE